MTTPKPPEPVEHAACRQRTDAEQAALDARAAAAPQPDESTEEDPRT